MASPLADYDFGQLGGQHAIVRLRREKKLQVIELSRLDDFDKKEFFFGSGALTRYDYKDEDAKVVKRAQVIKIGGNLRKFRLTKKLLLQLLICFFIRLFLFYGFICTDL